MESHRVRGCGDDNGEYLVLGTWYLDRHPTHLNAALNGRHCSRCAHDTGRCEPGSGFAARGSRRGASMEGEYR